MKKPFIILLMAFTMWAISNCGKKNISDDSEKQIEATVSKVVTKANTACNSSSPEQSLQWLSDIIKKAEEDRLTKKHMGNYIGRIFLTSYRAQPVFYIRMMMGSGGLYAYTYDCAGNPVTISQSDVTSFEQQVQNGTLIYSNMP